MLASVMDQFPDASDDCLTLGLIGSGIRQSLTPAMHDAEAAAQNIKLEYLLIDVDLLFPSGASLSELLQVAQNKGYRGLNITHPYKIAALEELDELSDSARKVGSINTILFEQNSRFGHNTDLWGFCENFRHNLPDVKMDNVLLMGAGGAGMAVAHGLAALGTTNLSICDMQIERAEIVAENVRSNNPNIQASAVSYDTLSKANFDGIVNATPVGMNKLPGSPVSKELLQSQHWVADLVYFPLETQLLRDAKERGCTVLPGSGMAVFQAVRAFKLFTGKEADASRMLQSFETISTNSSRQRVEG